MVSRNLAVITICVDLSLTESSQDSLLTVTNLRVMLDFIQEPQDRQSSLGFKMRPTEGSLGFWNLHVPPPPSTFPSLAFPTAQSHPQS